MVAVAEVSRDTVGKRGKICCRPQISGHVQQAPCPAVFLGPC
jgi:hypothetical protein